MLSTNRSKIIFLFLFVIIILTIIINLNNNKDNNSINYGDNFVLQNYINDNGEEINSALVIYDEDFKNIKFSKILDEVFDNVDQIDMNQNTIDNNEIHLMLSNSKTNINKKVIINLKDNKLLLENSKKEDIKDKNELHIGVGSNEKDILLELAKEDYYKIIADPNFIVDDKYYTFIDFEQLTNYVK